MPWCFNCSIKVSHKEGLRYIKSADWFISMNPTNWKKLTGFQIANQTLQIHFHQLCPTGGTREPSSPSSIPTSPSLWGLEGKGPSRGSVPLFSCPEEKGHFLAEAELGKV